MKDEINEEHSKHEKHDIQNKHNKRDKPGRHGRHRFHHDHGDELLKVEHLSVEYTAGKKTVHAVNDVSFDIRSGESLGIVGESGCGKSTIAKAILRILPDRGARISDGSIYYEGLDLAHMPEKKLEHIRGSRISMVFQDPMTALNPVKRVIQQVSSVIALHNPGISKREAVKRGTEMLKRVGITPDRSRDYPHQFSGGMQQRVEVAIALSCNPDLLLADEPTTALDVTIQAQVLDMMKDLMRQRNTALLLITHNLGIVAETCDYVAVIYGGEIVESGSREEIFDNPAHPYTIGLFGAIPDINTDTDRLQPIKGIMPEPTELPPGCKFHTRCPYATEECLDEPVPVAELGGKHKCKCHNISAVKANQAGEVIV